MKFFEIRIILDLLNHFQEWHVFNPGDLVLLHCIRVPSLLCRLPAAGRPPAGALPPAPPGCHHPGHERDCVEAAASFEGKLKVSASSNWHHRDL